MYLKYDRKTIEDFSDDNIESLYNEGYVFGRIEKGQMDQTRSLRIRLSDFETTSENRRILRKNENLIIQSNQLPLINEKYNWKIHKIGKDFYTTKFGDKTFSASKVKELCTKDHNFNNIYKYSRTESESDTLGYCISLKTNSILHYCYPFYDLGVDTRNLGMGMMLKAILDAKESGKNFVYLGSVQRETDKYKLQFKGLELWNNKSKAWDKLEI